ncbi:MAG: 23S rRNA (pseudouridine(1915)-N(3))-methyltransferase RlmH [Candidatus Methylomirabilis sp.]|nr:23S rRNA (pseudouridine(1915)-N(3))-methyltransferase RlmH [Deltaproteobacteria bacterium]
MKLRVYWTGKTRLAYAEEGVRRYRKLLAPRRAVEIREFKDDRPLAEALDAEADWIALDVGGALWDSERWAAEIGRRERAGTRSLAFVLGGPEGIPPDLLARAPVRVSFSPATFAHDLARVVLLEQLYRAASILDGLPYHRGG